MGQSKTLRCNHNYSEWSYDEDSRHRVCLECGDVDAEGLEDDDYEFARIEDNSATRSERRAFLLGRIEEANYWIDFYSTQKSKLAKKKLAEAKTLRDKDIQQLKGLR